MKYLFYAAAVILVFSAFNLLTQDKDNRDTMNVQELKNRFPADTMLVLLDVRTKEECEGPMKMISGAINIPVQELETRINELAPYKSREIAVICRSGNRSAAAVKLLLENGYKAVNVTGGMREYLK